MRSTRAHTAAIAHMAHGSRVTTSVYPLSRQSAARLSALAQHQHLGVRGGIHEFHSAVVVCRNDCTVGVEQHRADRHLACRRCFPSGGEGESHGIVKGGSHVFPTLAASRRDRIVRPSAHAWKACWR